MGAVASVAINSRMQLCTMDIKRAPHYLTLPFQSRQAMGGGEFPLKNGYTLPYRQCGQDLPSKGISRQQTEVRKDVVKPG